MAKKSGVKKVQDKLAAQKKQFDFLDTQRIVTIGKLQQRIIDLENEIAEYKKYHPAERYELIEKDGVK